jgi:hypothetical protein
MNGEQRLVPRAGIYTAWNIMFCAVGNIATVFAINNEIPHWTNNETQ